MYRNSSDSGLGLGFGLIVLVVALIFGFVVMSNHEHSSSGVVTVSDYEATIARGDTLILTHAAGKSTDYWYVSYDGDGKVTAKNHSALFPSDHTDTLCGIGCSKKLDLGWPNSLTMSMQDNGRVSIQWPWGWGYLRH